MIKAKAKSVLPESWLATYRHWSTRRSLPKRAQAEWDLDAVGLPEIDVGIEHSIEATLAWLCRAQDYSASRDGGVARDYSFVRGWNTSYPETTGYIVPTFIEMGTELLREDLLVRARKMLDWLVSIQLPDGGFQGGTVGQTPVRSVTFNSGQILMGLAAGGLHFTESTYLEAMHRTAAFLCDTQDRDGAWRQYPSPFAIPGDKAYETHVAWGLFEADRLSPNAGYGEAGLRQVRWALTRQEENGWYHDNDLTDPTAPLTHTIGYVTRGIIEAYRFSLDERLLNAAQLTCDSLIACLREDGWLAGRFNNRWESAVDWVCLTGTAQLAACWFLLAELTNESRYVAAARRANRFIRRTVRLEGDPNIIGGVKGSFPIYGDYCPFQYPNWAAKFFIESQRMEKKWLSAN